MPKIMPDRPFRQVWDHRGNRSAAASSVSIVGGPPQAVPHKTSGAPMSKRGRKKKDRKKSKANHGKRPNC